MLPALDALIALQQLDTAADAARKRLSELPAAEQAVETRVSAATAVVDAVKARIADNQQARRALDKDVAVVDARLARFDDHKAAVKTNQEYTALLHEIATAKTEKSAVEDRILELMESAETLAAELKAAEGVLAQERRDGDKARAALATEHTTLDHELARLAAERTARAGSVDARALATYEQLLKSRRGLAIVRLTGGICGGCHVRLRPHVEQQVKRNDSLVQCESCQRILYAQAPAAS